MRKLNLLKILVVPAILLLGILAGESTISKPMAGLPTITLAPSLSQPDISASSPMPAALVTTTDQPLSVDPTPGPRLTPTAVLPKEHYISDIRGHHQYFPLGCEAAAAKDWANYFEKDFNEFEFQYRLPASDNPDYGFVGSVEAPWGQVPPYGYGVYAGPVADLLNAYGIPAKAFKGYSLEQIKAKIAEDKPVIAWVIGNVVGGIPAEYTDKEGRTTIVAAYEHVVIVTGYNADHVRYMSNGKFYDTPDSVFLNSWKVLGNMVIVEN